MTDGSEDARHDQASAGRTSNADVGTPERWLSLAGGGTLLLFALRRGGAARVALALAGGGLVVRGATGRSLLYRALGINTASTHPGPAARVKHKQGIKVERTVTVDRPPDALFRFWRDFANLPQVMSHLESVRVLDDRRSHWVVKAPAGTQVAWDAEVYNERENELIAWRSLEGADIAHAGSVHFTPAPGGRGAEVRVVLEYDAPAGPTGALIARLFGEEPGRQVREDLRRFKQIMEAGEAATTRGQPAGPA